ncbi:hypothetical protein [Streptomyces sp. UNOC14_S4]|uniref:hypothetical protein n=1 Tax=Streptomyces sp. UNOC14_S4 TaxID=2872340 RepID=UPI001E4C92D0|nr:hypothetical protein [Streptomyces sp. UNOC14_S4]MCC3767297.1 hypothetical protein [Streptomyces sp. UNOC14_S4]
MPKWPDKTIPNFTDEELNAAIEQHESNPDPVIRQIVQGCWREWERRRGITIDTEEQAE